MGWMYPDLKEATYHLISAIRSRELVGETHPAHSVKSPDDSYATHTQANSEQ